MLRLAVLTASLLLLSGCVTQEPPAAPPEPDPAPQAEPGQALVFLPQAAPVEPLSNLTQFHWGLFEPTSQLVLQVTVDFGSGGTCELRDGSGSGPGPLGPRDLTLYEFEGRRGWSSSSSGSLASVHHGDLDTRTDSSGGGAGWSAHRGSFSGVGTVVYLARNVAPSDFLDGAAFFFTIECEQPFSILAADGGTNLLLADGSNLANGTGAETPASQANVQDVASATFTSPIVHAAADAFGYEATRIEVEHPAGTASWLWLPQAVVGLNAMQRVDGGPGAYSFTVDHAGAYFDAFWLAAWGLDGPVDLLANRLDQPVLESPFE